ncbi:hypothetical protein AB751O23_AX_00090 [Chlamydiales bacterium SCGC AB-751-O23]|jgi:hypothetical protein|nr:hypothetical protein AB751O23_AX_00090 [Chlamydiales bacterium SCGC AB-751-O23]
MTKDYVQKGGALLKEIAAELSIGSLPYFLEGGTFREDVSRSEMLRTINNFTSNFTVDQQEKLQDIFINMNSLVFEE